MPHLPLGKTPGVESARRLLNVLFSFSRDKPRITLDDVVQLTDISVPSAYRYISLLRELGLIEERTRGEYSLTSRVLQLSEALQRPYDLEEVARPHMHELLNSLEESVLLLILEKAQAKCVSMVQPERSLILSFAPGQYLALELGAGPKVLLAFAPEPFQQQYISRHVGDADKVAALEQDLQGIRASDIAVSAGEVDEGIWAVATPIRDGENVIAALTVAGPAFRISEKKRARITQELSEAASNLTEQLRALIE